MRWAIRYFFGSGAVPLFWLRFGNFGMKGFVESLPRLGRSALVLVALRELRHEGIRRVLAVHRGHVRRLVANDRLAALERINALADDGRERIVRNAFFNKDILQRIALFPRRKPDLASARYFAGDAVAILVLRAEPERRRRDREHVLGPRRLDRKRRRHSGEELLAGVFGLDDHGERHDVVRRRRRLPDLLHLALEARAVRVDGERDVLPHLNAADVGLGDVCRDPDRVEILRDREDGHRVHRRDDGLALLHLAVDHYAVDRRDDRAVAQVRLGLVYARLRALDLGLGARKRGLRAFNRGLRLRKRLLRAVEIGDRSHLLLRQRLLAVVRLLREDELGLALAQGAFARHDAGLAHVQPRDGALVVRLVDEGVDLRDDLPVRHDVVVVDVELYELAVDLRANRDPLRGIARRDGTRRGDRADDVRPGDRRGAVRRGLLPRDNRHLVAASRGEGEARRKQRGAHRLISRLH